MKTRTDDPQEIEQDDVSWTLLAEKIVNGFSSEELALYHRMMQNPPLTVNDIYAEECL